MNWLVLYHVTNSKEKDLFYQILDSIRKRVIKFNLHIVYLYTIAEDIDKGTLGRKEECKHYELHFKRKGNKEYPDDREILTILGELSPHYDGFVYSGHSSGYLFGREEDPIFSIVELAKTIEDTNHKFKVSIFDTCYVNNLETLYHLRHISDYIVATPSFCEDTSVLELDAFFDEDQNLVDYLKTIIDEYVIITESCPQDSGALRMSLVDTSGLEKLANSIRSVSPALTYDKNTIIHPADHKVHHICDVILNAFDDGNLTQEDLDHIVKNLRKTVIYSKSSMNPDSCHHTVCIGMYSELPYHPTGHEIEYFTF